MKTTRRQFLQRAGLAGLGLAVGSAGPAVTAVGRVTQVAPGRRPDMLLIIGDDMTWHECEPYGSTQVHTPNLARLAQQGMCFDAMFTATAMCAPTRQQLYTGLFPVRNGAYPNHSRVYDGVRSVVHHLADLGYRVGLIGKTHFGPAASFPFERLGDVDDAGCWQRIRAFVEGDRTQPYMLVFASHEPHEPWNRGDMSRYDPAKLAVPPYLVDCPQTRAALCKYYAEISYLDEQVGRCLRIVDESGRAEDTIVMFTSEQGSPMPMGGKWTCYDRGLKTAFIVRWPRQVTPGTRTSALTQYVDVVPTLIEAAGGDPTHCDPGRSDAHGRREFDGRSFLPVLLGKTDRHRDYVYGAQTTRGIIWGSACYPVRSIRSARYKYIRNLNHTATFYNIRVVESGGLFETWQRLAKTDATAAALVEAYIHRPAEELYDVQADPHELRNLADDPLLVAVKRDLSARLDAWMAQQGDEGIATEMRANERQGRAGRDNWKPYDPDHPPQQQGRKVRRGVR